MRQKKRSLARILNNFYSLAQEQHLLALASTELYRSFNEGMVLLGFLSPYYMSSLLKLWSLIAMTGPSYSFSI